MKDGSPTKVMLLDGTITDTWSNAWREECLKRDKHVQAVLGMVGRQYRGRRNEYCESVGRHEGEESERRLRDRIKKVWSKGVD